MEATLYQRRSGNGAWVMLLLLAMTFLVANAVISYGQHAVVQHGQDAILVRQCMEDRGPQQIWVHMQNGRVYHVCNIQPGVWGIMITDGTHEITAFIKNKMKSLMDVERYLRNIGAERLLYP